MCLKVTTAISWYPESFEDPLDHDEWIPRDGSGSLTTKTAPGASELSWAEISPPWALIIDLLMNNPRPVPWEWNFLPGLLGVFVANF